MVSKTILLDLENIRGKVDTLWSGHRMEENSLTEQAIYANGIIHDLKRVVERLLAEARKTGEDNG